MSHSDERRLSAVAARPLATGAPVQAHYKRRFAVEELRAGGNRLQRGPRRARGLGRARSLAARACAHLAGASVLLLPALFASRDAAQAHAVQPAVAACPPVASMLLGLSPAFGPYSSGPFGLVDVGAYSSPAFADLDGDGDLDAFVGKRDGQIVFFRNTGSATGPAFGSSSLGPFGLSDVGDYATPTFADLDADGLLDALVGTQAGSSVYFHNTGAAGSPLFAPPSNNPFGLGNVNLDASPTFADLDGDGDLDVLVGDRLGQTTFFRNTGSPTSPAFSSPSSDPFGLSDVGFNAQPALADLDGDGDLDAFVGNAEGNTAYFENTGTAVSPLFAVSSLDPFGLADVGWEAAPTFADLDGDGDLDAFIGNYFGETIYFENITLRPRAWLPVAVQGG
jgi:hypothetical protein